MTRASHHRATPEVVAKLRDWLDGWAAAPFTECARCHRMVPIGAWPFCKGNPEDHDR